MEEKIIDSLESLENFKTGNDIAVVYFSTEECNVCKVLKPKLKELLNEEFPKVTFGYVNLNNSREIAGQNMIFSVPTIVFYFNGSEGFRESRNINLASLHEKLARPYDMTYGN